MTSFPTQFWHYWQECRHDFRHDTPVEVGKPRYCPRCHAMRNVTRCEESRTARMFASALAHKPLPANPEG